MSIVRGSGICASVLQIVNRGLNVTPRGGVRLLCAPLVPLFALMEKGCFRTHLLPPPQVPQGGAADSIPTAGLCWQEASCE